MPSNLDSSVILSHRSCCIWLQSLKNFFYKSNYCFFLLGIDESGGVKYYNSACFVDPSGALLLTYQKSFLYDTDKTWAEEGSGFKFIDVPEIGRV
jgi:predicted amidohydrolase